MSDKATALFMQRFYRYLHAGLGKAEALKLTKQSFLNDPDRPELKHPFFWAPFILVGEVD